MKDFEKMTENQETFFLWPKSSIISSRIVIIIFQYNVPSDVYLLFAFLIFNG